MGIQTSLLLLINNNNSVVTVIAKPKIPAKKSNIIVTIEVPNNWLKTLRII